MNTRQTLEPVHVRAEQLRPVSATATVPGSPAPIPLPTSSAAAVAQSPKKVKPVAVNKAPRQPSGGVTHAIIATVVIVLGLAALAVFAYIKTKK
jgi:hypothetical protein